MGSWQADRDKNSWEAAFVSLFDTLVSVSGPELGSTQGYRRDETWAGNEWMTGRRVSVPVWGVAAVESKKILTLLTGYAGQKLEGRADQVCPQPQLQEEVPRHSHSICVCAIHAQRVLGSPAANRFHEQAGELWDDWDGLWIWYQSLSQVLKVSDRNCLHHPPPQFPHPFRTGMRPHLWNSLICVLTQIRNLIGDNNHPFQPTRRFQKTGALYFVPGIQQELPFAE